MNQCKICNNSANNDTYSIKEMMVGERKHFEYFKCSKCGCLQIIQIPQDIDKYYKEDYYSIDLSRCNKNATNTRQKYADKYKIFRKSLLGRLLSLFTGRHPYCDWLRKANVNYESKILDIGSGSGSLLFKLLNIGFKNLHGIDPYIKKDFFFEDKLKIFKKELTQLKGEYDLIIFSHSLEHMENQFSIMKKTYDLLKDDGMCVVRLPLVSSYAWREYKTNWVQIDAPRHFYLHSLSSFNILLNKCGFSVVEVTYDSSSFQFWGSELYQKDIPLSSRDIFSKKQIRFFRKKAHELNKLKDGDQACFMLRKNLNK